VRFVIDYLCNVSNPKASSKFATAKNRILAYRVSQMDPVQQKEVLAEGFDDDGEDGSGDKLLTVLQKMDITNIMVVVCIWNSGVTIGDSRLRGGEFFRIITDRARELLTSIKEGVQ
jgi:putative IMPACT (imprinted ancient) family translation regulator